MCWTCAVCMPAAASPANRIRGAGVPARPALGGEPPPTRGGSVRNQRVQLVQVSQANSGNTKEVNVKAILREYKGMQGMYRGYMKRYTPNTKECKGNPPSKWLPSMYSLNTKASPQGVTGFRDIDFPVMNSPRNSMYDDIFTGDTPQKWISSTISLRESPYGRIPEGFPQGCRS